MPNMQRKLWGWTRRLEENPVFQMDEIWGEAGGASSLHDHADKSNYFLVYSGILEIHYGNSQVAVCKPGWDPLMVPSGLSHRMVFPADCHAIELYVPARLNAIVSPDDIRRFDQGRPSNAYSKEQHNEPDVSRYPRPTQFRPFAG